MRTRRGGRGKGRAKAGTRDHDGLAGSAREAGETLNNRIPADLGIELDDDTPHDPAFGYKSGRSSIARRRSIHSSRRRCGSNRPKTSRRGGSSLTDPFESADPPRTPLQLTDRELQDIIDARVVPPSSLGTVPADRGARQRARRQRRTASLLLREYVEQNGLQPYADGATRDGRLWVQLGLAADHADFIGYITRYAREHAGTKASVELLFLLEKLAEASLDALVTLIDIDRQRDLGWTMRTHRFAYAAIATIQDHYKTQLAQMRLTSRDDLIAYYDRIRLTILQTILDTAPAGYRAADARFLMGAILWKRGKMEDAERVWRQMKSMGDPDDSYAESACRILAELRTWDATRCRRTPTRAGSTASSTTSRASGSCGPTNGSASSAITSIRSELLPILNFRYLPPIFTARHRCSASVRRGRGVC